MKIRNALAAAAVATGLVAASTVANASVTCADEEQMRVVTYGWGTFGWKIEYYVYVCTDMFGNEFDSPTS